MNKRGTEQRENKEEKEDTDTKQTIKLDQNKKGKIVKLKKPFFRLKEQNRNRA